MVKLFGTTVKETISTFESPHLGNDQNVVTREDKIKVTGRLVITILLIFIATYCLISDMKDIAGTLFGGIVGYWLR